MKLNRLLLIAIVAPSVFVVSVILVSYLPHRAELLTHGQEHLLLSAVMVAGIVPFAVLMVGIFRRIEAHILRQNEELGRRARETEALLKVSTAVKESLDLDRVLSAAVEAVVEATSAETAEVWLVDEGGASVSLRQLNGAEAAAFRQTATFPRGQGHPGVVVETGRPILRNDLAHDPLFRRDQVKAAGFRVYHALPLRASRGVVGVLSVASRHPGALSGPDESRLLELMADQVATAVENAKLHEEVQALAIVTERERLAREMHDGLAQVLGYVNTKAQAVKALLEKGQGEQAARHMEQLETAARETYDDVREAILALATDGRKRPLIESLGEYIRLFGELSGLPAQFVVTGEPRPLNPLVELQLLRIVQEALANVRKHAHASEVRVAFDYTPNGYCVSIEDDGRGFDPAHPARGPWPHLGLQSMQERASAISAVFTLDTAPGRGTRIQARYQE